MPKLVQLAKQSLVVVLMQGMAFVTTPAAAQDPAAEPPSLVADLSSDQLEMLGAAIGSDWQDGADAIGQRIAQAGRPGQPPQAAIDACQGRTEESPCSFAGPDGEAMEGVCRSGPRGEAAACAPAGQGGGGGGSRPRR